MAKSTKSKTIKKTTKKTQVVQEDSLKLHKQLKTSSYNTSLTRIRKRLPNKKQRAFSRFIHAKGMDSTNDILVATIGRPSSIIGGSIFALIGVGIGVYLSRYYGYSFNYLLLFLFFIMGYAVELLIETIIKFFVRYKS